jgi:hypothetical protein
MDYDMIVKGIFLVVSGIALLFTDPLLWVAWPIALAAMIYAQRIWDSPIVILCGGVPLAVAVGYASLVLSMMMVFLLVASAIGLKHSVGMNPQITAVVLILGSILILFLLLSFDPFIGSLLIMAAVLITAGLLSLFEHAACRSVRGDQV